MESFTRDFVGYSSAQLLPDKTLRSFTNFLQGQVNVGGQWEIANSEKPYPSR